MSTERHDAILITDPRDAVNGNVVVEFHNQRADRQVRSLRGIKLKGDNRSELHCQMLYICNRGGAKLNRKTTTKTQDTQTKQNHGCGCKSTFTIRRYFNGPRLLVDAGNALCVEPGGCVAGGWQEHKQKQESGYRTLQHEKLGGEVAEIDPAPQPSMMSRKVVWLWDDRGHTPLFPVVFPQNLSNDLYLVHP